MLKRGSAGVNIGIRAVDSHDQYVVKMFLEADELYSTLYPSESNHPAMSEDFLPDSSILLGAYFEESLIGTGGVIYKSDGYGEIKRMYVDSSYRRSGVGSALLHELILVSIRRGVGCLKLETGILQPEAIGLYRLAGFQQIPPFGDYVEDPNSVFFQKNI